MARIFEHFKYTYKKGLALTIVLNPVPCFTFSNADKAHISPFWVSILVMINPTSTDMHMLTSGTDEYVKKKFHRNYKL